MVIATIVRILLCHFYSSTSTIWSRRGPWAPKWIVIEISPVREGPVITITENRQLYFQEDAVTMDELVERLAPYLPD